MVICLHATLETILQRTAQARTRPLLNVEDPEARIRQLYAEREEIYKRAGTVILTDFRPLHDIVHARAARLPARGARLGADARRHPGRGKHSVAAAPAGGGTRPGRPLKRAAGRCATRS